MSPPLVQLGEVAKVKSGFAFSSKDWTDSGVPVVKIANVKDGSLDMSGCSYVSDEVAASGADYRLRRGDILIAMTGYVGEVALVRTGTYLLLNQRVGRFTINESKVDPGYFFQLVHGNGFKVAAQSLGYGSAQPNVSPRLLESIVIPLPPLAEQRGIAARLGALDDKIESNHRARDLIKGLLLAAFEELLAKNKFEEVPLAGIATSTKGVSYKSVDLLPSRTSLVTLKSIDRSGGYKSNGLKQYVGPYKPQQVTLPGDIVVAQTDLTQGAEVVGRAVRVPPEDSASTLVASLDLVIVRPNPDIPTEYLLGVLTDERFRAHCCSRTSGTTVLHLASDAIPTYMAPLVGTDVREDFASRARPLVERGDGLASETRSLIALRDTLLPELLSGRIRVSEARGVVEEAVG